MICTKCKKDKKESDFSWWKPRRRLCYQCKECRAKIKAQKGKKNKERAIEIKGGACSICGYCRCYKALEFHHKDEKTYDISKLLKKSWKLNEKKILQELDKCMLVCSNCHREIHSDDQKNNKS